jgi:hypothetical protein
MVVLPAASRPTIKIRISFLPNCITEHDNKNKQLVRKHSKAHHGKKPKATERNEKSQYDLT